MRCAVTAIGESADPLHRVTRGHGAYHRIVTSSPMRLSGGRLSLAASLRATSIRASDATSRRIGPIGTGGSQGKITKNFLGSMSYCESDVDFPIKRFRSIAMHEVETPLSIRNLRISRYKHHALLGGCRCRVALNSDYRTSILATELTY